MKKVLGLLCFYFCTTIVYAQKEATPQSKYWIGLHYVSNIDNKNLLSENYNGILGVDAKYNLLTGDIINLQGGVAIDFFSGKRDKDLDLKYNMLFIVNPNIGGEFNVFTSNFRPFINVGYAYLNYSYNAELNILNTGDPLINPNNLKYIKLNFNEHSFSLQPGFRYIFTKSIYLESSYKYLPINNNFNMHFFTIGLGVHF